MYDNLEKHLEVVMTALEERCQKIQVTQVAYDNKVAVNLLQIKLYGNRVNFPDFFYKLIDKNASLSLPEKMQNL